MLVLSTACGGPSDSGVQGTYELIRADGAALPTVLASDSLCITQLVSARLSIDADEYRSTYDIRRTCARGDMHTAPDPGVTGRYRIQGDSMYFVDPDGRDAGAGVFGADTMVIRGPEHVLTFQRISTE